MKYANKLAAALALAAVAPLAHAGDTFIDARIGTAKLNDTGYDDTRTGMQELAVGHRWGFGPAHIGFEVGGGNMDALKDDYQYDDGDEHYRLKTSYGFVGANGRIDLPASPIYFTGRLGYMGYEQREKYRYTDYTDNSYGGWHDHNDGGGVYYGVGVGWTILPTFSVNLNYTGLSYAAEYCDDYDCRWGDTKTAHAVTVGAEFRF